MSTSLSTPSVTELCLLKALWKDQPQSARQLHASVQAELDWSFSSTRKTVERMLEKGLLSQRSLHGVLVYEPQADKVATLAAFAHDFGRRVMEIDTPLPVSMFTGSKLVDGAELAELEQLLHDWPQDGKE
ncbi:BlaI/MecI/CopY family transcriptional regulator [Janthinobacterium aquaticum]|uniref:BlaI/MecI/CopY family transcriptional regulator n=1 Tax=Janthinobacterium sp. FT58W TaxID=2654254 RepID=UPI00126590BD|nr:BlaI/MecI/CopY family transcriptional regulator [Janthinobacterium sp. FT58W]KAB8042825.1 BlaI/MecI/CopY family transcriptional regulator [Janthinobacterium sp. FT58W]